MPSTSNGDRDDSDPPGPYPAPPLSTDDQGNIIIAENLSVEPTPEDTTTGETDDAGAFSQTCVDCDYI